MSDTDKTAGEPLHVVWYDGECSLCHSIVRILIAADEKRRLRFAPLGGETAAQFIASGIIPDLPPDRVHYLDRSRPGEAKLWAGSDAVFQILRTLGGFWWLLSHFRFVPRFMREGVYRFIARFGRTGSKNTGCPVPNPEQAELFLP